MTKCEEPADEEPADEESSPPGDEEEAADPTSSCTAAKFDLHADGKECDDGETLQGDLTLQECQAECAKDASCQFIDFGKSSARCNDDLTRCRCYTVHHDCQSQVETANYRIYKLSDRESSIYCANSGTAGGTAGSCTCTCAGGYSGTHCETPPQVKIYLAEMFTPVWASAGTRCGLRWKDSWMNMITLIDGGPYGYQTKLANRDAFWDCTGSADPVTIEGGKIYADTMARGVDATHEYDGLWGSVNHAPLPAPGTKCGLQWDGELGTTLNAANDMSDPNARYDIGDNERHAKWNCKGSADPVTFETTSEGDKIYALAHDTKCALEWGGELAGSRQVLEVKWDCGDASTRGDAVIIEPVV